MTRHNTRIGLAAALVVVFVAGMLVALRSTGETHRTRVIGYFANSNGIYIGDEVRIRGVRVGKIDSIEPEPQRVKITFWYDSKYKVPADAKAVILSPSLVAVRAIQLTPAYKGGPVMADHTLIPEDRTAVPVEWDDFRQQLQKLTEALQPTQPGGVSNLGAFVNTAADNLRGQGANVRDTLIKLSQAFSAVGDHSTDLFSTIKHLSILVSALQSSQNLLRSLNQNLAGATGLLSADPNAVGNAVSDINNVVGDVQRFAAEHRESLGTTSDKLASITQALNDSIPDIKQTLHIAAPAFQNFVDIYQPAQGTLAGALAVNNFANPIQFLCSAVEAASRLNSAQSAKLCVQYLAPIIKNRQYNFPFIGENLFVGATARPNELTYSEDWLRPDYVPPAGSPPAAPPPAAPNAPPTGLPVGPPPDVSPPSPTQAQATDPAQGLRGIMLPPRGGS